MKLKILLLCSFFLSAFINESFAQSFQVTGKVTNRVTAEPLAGASISVRGTTTGTVTDAQGNYTITVPGRGSVIIVSYAGLTTQEFSVNQQGAINVQLDNTSNRLSEV